MIAVQYYKLKEWIGESYLILSVLVYWVMTGAFLNFIAIALFLVLMTLVITRNAIFGWVIGLVFLLINLYMILAMIDELAEFPVFNRRAADLLIGGSLYLGANIFASVLLLVKWGRKIGA